METQGGIWVISIQILIENEGKLVWTRPGRDLTFIYPNLYSAWKEARVGQPRTESNLFQFDFI